MDRLQAMEVFVRVVDTGAFTRAADALHMPKATVTTLIKNLEAHLGTKLLNRTTRRVTVTTDGAAYYERCLSILAQIDETEGALTHTNASPRGRLRVDVPVTFGRRVLAPTLPDFLARYPDIRLEVGCSDRPADLIEEGVDCVVRGGVQPDSSLVARPVGVVDFTTCATPRYVELYGMPMHPDDLLRHRCINYFSAKTGRIRSWNFNKDGHRIDIEPESFLAFNDGEAYLEAGLADLGVIHTGIFLVRHAIDSGKLVQVLPDWRTDPLPVWVMYPQNRHLSAKVRVFVEWIAELFDARALQPGTRVPPPPNTSERARLEHSAA